MFVNALSFYVVGSQFISPTTDMMFKDIKRSSKHTRTENSLREQWDQLLQANQTNVKRMPAHVKCA